MYSANNFTILSFSKAIRGLRAGYENFKLMKLISESEYFIESLAGKD